VSYPAGGGDLRAGQSCEAIGWSKSGENRQSQPRRAAAPSLPHLSLVLISSFAPIFSRPLSLSLPYLCRLLPALPRCCPLLLLRPRLPAAPLSPAASPPALACRARRPAWAPSGSAPCGTPAPMPLPAERAMAQAALAAALRAAADEVAALRAHLAAVQGSLRARLTTALKAWSRTLLREEAAERARGSSGGGTCTGAGSSSGRARGCGSGGAARCEARRQHVRRRGEQWRPVWSRGSAGRLGAAIAGDFLLFIRSVGVGRGVRPSPAPRNRFLGVAALPVSICSSDN
jgi:hypothetical protein